ncbi:MAG: xanthine dehydrogenase accessory protein XdhC [Thiofilum sp.]|uniref:xanthine dehydrogenase accessory protein XdhC n=1 Tax=Thiofilum sp. TaxID=2212733 RepID=UPI0025F1DD29|nr:xanthine dehydrogenase accessory protein XdhC [Thiofilum sp.]MBK8455105.1 xanthine dehydrogenase accessory protein XdhC [Thiofilum sp.]
MMSTQHWTQVVADLHQANQPYVLITVLQVRGSAPRHAGTKMVVSHERTWGSIGGGNLEFQAIQQARQLLQEPYNQQRLQELLLSTDLQQCCGGAVTVLLESFVECEQTVWLFGAGHVAQALVTILMQLPVRVHWVDSRAELFPPELPSRLMLHYETGVKLLEQIQAQHDVIVLTHDHQLDFDLVHALLSQGTGRFVGLIGSETKARRFRQRLAQAGLESHLIERLVCPVGLKAVTGKRPMEVAVSIAGQLIALWQQAQPSKQA